MERLFLILGICCIVYYLGILCYAGPGASFAGIWLILGGCLLLLAAVPHVLFLQEAVCAIPRPVKLAGGAALALAAAGFLVIEGLIVSGMVSQTKTELDYVIVLGAQVKGTKVSRALSRRLDRAYEYLSEHPNTQVIVSGGQGPGEDISEAEAMEAYLLAKGIDGQRIQKEDQSVNTAQNIRFSYELIEDKTVAVGLVSSDFHIFRAVHIAKAHGYLAKGLAAPSDIGMYPHFMMREAFAVVKDLLYGNMVL